MINKELIKANDVAAVLDRRMTAFAGESEEAIASGFSDEGIALFYNELKTLRDQGFLKSLALFIDHQAKKYAQSNKTPTEAERLLIKNISSLYQSLDNVSSLSKWDLYGIAQAGMQAMSMLKPTFRTNVEDFCN